jgi:hypothetical protein
MAFILMKAVPHTNATTVEALSRRAAELLASGSPSEAASIFRAAIEAGDAPGPLPPSMFEAHLGLIRALRAAGRLELSIGAALALTALSPSSPQAHVELAISLHRAGHVPQAQAASARARILAWKLMLTEEVQS